MDNYITLSNRLQSRCPAVDFALSQQLIQDSWRTLQSMREWSWRRRSGIFAPPNLYQTGTVTTNVAAGNPTLLTGSGTVWTPDMIGRQIRVGGLLNPYYTIVAFQSPTAILIDAPWAGTDVVNQTYQMLQIWYPVPDDFNYFYTIVSIKDAYRLWTNITAHELSMLDPQRTNQGQTYAAVFHDYTSLYGGTIGPVIPISAAGGSPVSTTSTGYSYVSNATYIIQVAVGGLSGTATFQWLRSGQPSYQPAQATSAIAQDLADGVQIYWPTGVMYTAGDLFIINAQSSVISSGPRYELWPGPTFTGYLYPYIYIAKEYDLTAQSPQLPPFVANRGEVILEMALAACARYPGPSTDKPNVYYDLRLALMHEARAEKMIWDMERNDEEVGVSNISYEQYPWAPAPWQTGSWQASHAPFFTG